MMTLQRMEIGSTSFSHEEDSFIHHRHLSPLRSPDLYVIARSKLRFCFVRNPYDRLLSCYLDKVYEEDSPLERQFQNALQKSGPVSFREFIDVICDEPKDMMEPHYAPQAHVTCQDPYDFVGHFETLDHDISSIAELVGVDIAPYAVRIDAHKTGKKPYEWLDSDLVAKIKSKFEEDFDTFKYHTTPPST